MYDGTYVQIQKLFHTDVRNEMYRKETVQRNYTVCFGMKKLKHIQSKFDIATESLPTFLFSPRRMTYPESGVVTPTIVSSSSEFPSWDFRCPALSDGGQLEISGSDRLFSR